MPELPEVQTVVNELNTYCKNKIITEIHIISNRLVEKDSLSPDLLIGRKITSVDRRGKYIIFRLDSPDIMLIMHLRMTGKFVFDLFANDQKYVRASFVLNMNDHLYFVDIRQFGTFLLTSNTEYLNQKLGPEPLSDDFSFEYFYRKLRKINKPIKNSLLDQKIVAGIGNIYADESLFLSKIKPIKKSRLISKKKLKDLHSNIRLVLQLAINNMGTTLSDYRTTKNIAGQNQNYLYVYGRNGKLCHICYNIIVKIKLSGRSAHFCPKCQSY